MPECAFNEGLRGRTAVLAEYFLVKRSGVHPDADGDPALLRRRDHARYRRGIPDISRVDSQSVGARFHRGDRETVIEMDIRDEGWWEPACVFSPRAAAALSSGTATRTISHPASWSLRDLVHGRVHVPGIGVRHGLHRDGSASAYGDVPHMDPASCVSCGRHRVLNSWDSPIQVSPAHASRALHRSCRAAPYHESADE